MRNTLIFPGNSCPGLTAKICENLGMLPAEAELTQFSNGETSVRILTSVREKDVFIVQSGSPNINDTIMELLIMISACKGGSANKITAVLPYFPYSRQSKKKSHRGAITARMLANLLHVAGVKHVVTVDLHASQMQGFFQCPVDNLHAEPLIARWIRHNVPNWREAVVVSKNAGGTKRVTSLADALKLNFGMVTTDKRRGTAMTASMIMNDEIPLQSMLDGDSQNAQGGSTESELPPAGPAKDRASRIVADSQGSPRRLPVRTSIPPRSPYVRPRTATSQTSAIDELDEETETDDAEFNDQRAHDVTHGRLVHGHIVPDDFPSPATSAADASVPEDDPMTMSHASSFFQPEPHALGGSGEEGDNSDDDEEIITNSKVEHMITLVGDVKNRTVLIVDDMIDKPGSWIAAAETVVKRGLAKKVFCIATHGIFGGDCLEQMQACDCIDTIVVTNSYPVPESRQRASSKLVLLDLSFLLGEAIRRNHYGESISPLFQHIVD
ncbi:phosphoribosyl pyrophosphokinase [Coniochaeta ligniaria NRRL 30616]|uniref:Ribose-phosphate pyrophosphokinase 1 n=1 Tax=Coniochaeta ligniaria NRRL 30616 TaxID=1408157 RepID=A0A1J7JXH2_9PEZI|nr:phosphoribosyl pyrophosphokinase [Coniochaeta ligniaria NRRL 30616]